jgi:NAD+ synthase
MVEIENIQKQKDDCNERRILLAQMNPELVANEIGDFVVGKVLEFKKTGGVMGLSGGVDSTTVAAITKRAFDKYNAGLKDGTSLPLELVGYILPSKTNDVKDSNDGIAVANRLGLRYEVRSIQNVLDAYKTTNSEALDSKFHKGNLTSEIRATVLHAKAAVENKSLIGTGNKDEDYGVGFYTLFGDGAVHMSPIGNLPKRLIREMAVYLGFKDLAYRVSTPGLEEGQTSFKDLGYDYEFAEVVLEGFDQGFTKKQLVTHSQVVFYAEKQIQKYVELYGKAKFESIDTIITDVERRHATALKKSELVSPEIAKVTLNYM